MRAQQDFSGTLVISDVKGVPHVTGRVIRRDIQQFKVIAVPLDLRAGYSAKSEGRKNLANAPQCLSSVSYTHLRAHET